MGRRKKERRKNVQGQLLDNLSVERAATLCKAVDVGVVVNVLITTEVEESCFCAGLGKSDR